MRSPLRLFAALAVPLAGCHRDDGAAAAAQTFTAFQQALLAGNEGRCRELLTRESASALADMPWASLRERQPLQVQRAEAVPGAFHVGVVDPNTNGGRGTYVVVREYGRLVVDLVASAGMHQQAVEATARPSEELEPRELTPADFDRIREYELAQPPK